MALLATVPHPVQLVRSRTAYLVAPAPLGDGVAYLTVPRRNGGPDVAPRVVGDRLVVIHHGVATELVDGDCDSADGCAAVGAPAGDGTDVVFGLPLEGGGGYVGRAGTDGHVHIVHLDETSSAPPEYAAAAGRTVFLQRGAIAIRTGAPRATVLITRPGTGGTVTALAASPNAIAWTAQVGTAQWSIAVKVGAGPVRRLGLAVGGIAPGGIAVADDGTVAWTQRTAAGPGLVRVQVVVLKPGATALKVVATSPLQRADDPDPLPRLALSGSTLAYRLRSGAGGRAEAIFATDLATGGRRLIVRLPRRASRLSDPAIGVNRILWAQTDFRAGRFVRSRILRVRVAL
jgi:hypothetical protein